MELHQPDTKTKNKGFVALISVIVLSVVAVIVVTSAFSAGTNTLVNIATTHSALRAKANADSCVEIAINKLKTDLNYSGNENVAMDCGSCTISIISGTGNTNRTFTSSGNCDTVVRRMSVSITTVDPTTVVDFWREIQ